MSRISYEKMDPITHIHKRPDMYLGTLEPKAHDPEWVFDGTRMTLLKDPIYSDGLWRIFLEPISNVVDNVWRSRQAGVECKKIKVDIDPETAEITIWNDGRFIPIEINEQTRMHNPELIFGNLLTSSNYNDEEERLSSGRNGLGVKLTNVFSTSFHIECGDPEKGVVYSQTWKNHMRDVQKPKIKNKQNTGYTCVKFTPDLSLFHMEKLDDTIMGLFRKTCVDMSMLTSIPVLLNKEKINIHSLKEYATLYPQVEGKHCIHWNNNDIQKKKGEELEVVVCPSFDEEYHEIAFVNGIYNKEGGAHADAVSSEFFKTILTKINKGRTVNTFSAKDVKPQFTIFVRASLINPSFSNQNKTRLQSPAPKVAVDPKFIQTVCSKWGFMEKMNELIQAREFISLKKTEKKRGYKKIEGLDNANKAGGKESRDCTLILCEGLSAKTYTVKGIGKGWNGKKGRDYFGVFPLRGKVMNARNATTSSISANKEITSVIQALNLKYKTDYTQEENFNTLSYGKVMIITDADVDGLHIASLIINMFHVLFPSLFRREEPFLYSMMTPIAKIFPTADQALTFYNDFEYQKELDRLTGKKFRTKYYKGLGSSSDQEIKDTFGEKVVSFQLDNKADQTLHMVFSKNTADDRKKWLEDYNPEGYETPGDTYNITDFVNNEHIRFSIDDCKRNIPNLCDGLKLSQRKILYTVFKRNLSYNGKSIKVAQLAGSVAELSNYHHGEQCLYDTIVKLAQEFVGSLNNIPLLFRDGQFGCLAPETPILMWDSSIKRADEIQIGDILVGDDGNPRNVLQLTNGDDNMYEVQTSIDRYNFVCNSQHILTLYFKDNNIIYWKDDTKTWIFEYFDGTDIILVSKRTNELKTQIDNHHNKSKLDKMSAYNQIVEIRDNIQKKYFKGPVVDIKLVDYMNLSETNKHRMRLFTIMNAINWPKKDVPIDPYIFGAWLGDGNADGSGFTTADEDIVKRFVKWADNIGCEVVHHTNGKDHENYHYGIRKKGSGRANMRNPPDIYKISIGDKNHSSEKCLGCTTSNKKHPACDWYFEKSAENLSYMCHGKTIHGSNRKDLNPFKQILKTNNLLMNKHIPINYLYNDIETRLQLLAGFIDTDGSIKNNRTSSPSIEISQSERLHKDLIYSLELIAKSLGFKTSISKRRQTKTTKKGKDSTILLLLITGENLDCIPTIIPRKQIVKNGTRIMSPSNTMSFTIKELGINKFYGWQVDGNERFLLGNFIVTHNSRLTLGKDAANGRYIHTKMEKWTRILFPEMDDDLLSYTLDDGLKVEPDNYIPIVPMILINGVKAGIGSGWSSNIASHNPLELVQCVRDWLDDQENFKMPVLKPYFHGFYGEIKKVAQNKFKCIGVITETEEDKPKRKKAETHRITEIPIDCSIDKYKEFIETLMEEKKLKSFKNYSKPNQPDFHITPAETFKPTIDKLNLSSDINMTNIVLFNDGKIKKYNTIQEIFIEFCRKRHHLYEKRKNKMVKILESSLEQERIKHRFITDVMDDKIAVFRKTEEEVEEQLKKHKYQQEFYPMLYSIQIRAFTKDNVSSLEKKIHDLEKQLKELKKTTIVQMWNRELDMFVEEYSKE